MNRIKVAYHWKCMGPYHFARMNALAESGFVDLYVIESEAEDDHHWQRHKIVCKFNHLILHENDPRKITTRLQRKLNQIQPRVLVVNGYSGTTPKAVVRRFRNRGGIVVGWSVSTANDRPRTVWKEWMKRIRVRNWDGAIVAGRPQQEYLESLGMPSNRIKIVGNVVDNRLFSERAMSFRLDSEKTRKRYNLPEHYFLYVGRFIPCKNLLGLLSAYAQYVSKCRSADPCNLVLVGQGEMEHELRTKVLDLRLQGVWFMGVAQIDDLPAYYAMARCLILPSWSETWGLVVNEAMACGLPVLVSNRCGCVEDLISDGMTGLLFDPADENCLVHLMGRISEGSVNLKSIGQRAVQKIQEFTPGIYGDRVGEFLHSICAS